MGNPFYGPYDAQELVKEHADELGVKPLTFTELVYVPSEDRYEEVDRLHPEVETRIHLRHPGTGRLSRRGQAPAVMVHQA